MGYLNREDILKVDDVEIREVDVPEWGGTVRVRALSGYDRDAYQASMLQFQKDGQASPELGNMTAKLVSRSIVDEDGNQMFNELDVGRLGQKSSAALDRVSNVAAEISGLTAKSQEVAEGNSETGPSAGSFSPSPEN
jgi:hypothetical protein